MRVPRLQPPNPYWDADLPPRSEPPHEVKDPAGLDFTALTPTVLELSRANTAPRGLFLLISIFGLVLYGTLNLNVTYRDLVSGEFEPIAWIFFIFTTLSFGGAILHTLRIDTRMPLDTPVRFNRHTGKVYVSDYNWNWNPLGRWKSCIREYDWNTLEAEIEETTTFNGENFQTRSALVLAQCKPGTTEVIERFTLESGHATTLSLQALWGVLRHYMAHGMEGLPPRLLQPPPRKGMVDHLFHYAPWFAPTAYGRGTRRAMNLPSWFGALLVSAFVPVWVTLGIAYLIVTFIAPQANWPVEIEIASTGH